MDSFVQQIVQQPMHDKS